MDYAQLFIARSQHAQHVRCWSVAIVPEIRYPRIQSDAERWRFAGKRKR